MGAGRRRACSCAKGAVGRHLIKPYTPPVRKALRGGALLHRGFFLASALAALLLGALAPGARAYDAYVTNEGSNSVSVINTKTNRVVGSPISVGAHPIAIAITPDGKSAYVVNTLSDSVSVIDTQTKRVVGSPIRVDHYPVAIAITSVQPVTVAYPAFESNARQAPSPAAASSSFRT